MNQKSSSIQILKSVQRVLTSDRQGFAVHCIRGIFGTVIIALFGQGRGTAQLGGLVIVGVFTVVVTFILIKLVGLLFPLHVDIETESNGLDLSVHGERAYEPNN
jgi:Amt family ammonium transporter